MNDQMSQYPPPPPPDQQHYTPIYQAAAGNQLLDAASQAEQLQQFNAPINQALYPKVEPGLLDQNNQNHQAHVQNNVDPRVAPPPSAQGTDAQQKANRLRKACDSCSIRKVKCDESGPPCRACAALDIPCTFNRPSRRRGPPNRHAEAIKKRRLESTDVSDLSSPSSPTNAAHALASLSSHPTLSAESIISIDIINLLIDDFFTYIHPLCPFPHELWFRENFRQRRDYTDRPFLALLASMIGAVVASFPRKPRQHLKANRKEKLFPTHMSLVNRCQQVCTAARGTAYLEREDLNIYDSATSYFLGLMGAYTFRWRQCRLYFGECLTILRGLGLHRDRGTYTPAQPQGQSGTNGPTYEVQRTNQLDCITQEMGRRVFWTVFVSWRSMQQMGSSFGEIVILPATPTEPHPPLPVEVDDEYITPTHIGQQPLGIISQITGFNVNVKTYSSYNPIATMEMAYGSEEVFDWERQKRCLDQSLQNCRAVLDGVPPELTVWPQPSQFGAQSSQNYFSSQQDYSGTTDPALMPPYEPEDSPAQKRRTQYEIQKANIYASLLSTRSYLVEKYFNLAEAHAKMQNSSNVISSPGVVAAGLETILPSRPTSNYDTIGQEMAAEREQVIKDLLVVLGSISPVMMEPNADSFTTKIRLIASTLLNVPRDRKGSVALQAEEYLARFLEILVKLERVSPANSEMIEDPDDEEAALRHWADLRENQQKLANEGEIFAV